MFAWPAECRDEVVFAWTDACITHMRAEIGGFVLTPRAAYHPAIPRNSDRFLRSLGWVYSMGIMVLGSRLPSRRGMDLVMERCVGSREPEEEPSDEPLGCSLACARFFAGPAMADSRRHVSGDRISCSVCELRQQAQHTRTTGRVIPRHVP